MRDLDDLAASAGATVGALAVAQKRGVRQAALHATTVIRAEIRSATGDMRLSGVGKRGARVGAKFDVKGSENPTALIRGTGPIHLIERDTSAHVIFPRGQTFSTTRKGNVRRRGRTRALKFGGRFSAYSEHPGTRGKHPFEKGWRKAAPDTPKIFQREVRDAIRRTWT